MISFVSLVVSSFHVELNNYRFSLKSETYLYFSY